jgi:hypothetical protein
MSREGKMKKTGSEKGRYENMHNTLKKEET